MLDLIHHTEFFNLKFYINTDYTDLYPIIKLKFLIMGPNYYVKSLNDVINFNILYIYVDR